MKRKNKKNNRIKKTKKSSGFILPSKIKCKILGVVMILLAIIIGLSFFGSAGLAGEWFMKGFTFLVGKVIFTFPLFLVLGGLIFWEGVAIFRRKWWLAILALFIFVLSLSGILGSLNHDARMGGWLGYAISWPLLKFFEFWVTIIIFSGIGVIAGVITFYPLYQYKKRRDKAKEEEGKISFIKRDVFPSFKVKQIFSDKPEASPEEREEKKDMGLIPDLKLKQVPISTSEKKYEIPPFDLLEGNKGAPKSGDLKINAAIIKRTLQNFGIPVEMGQVNIGPTVTQYTLKPSEGVKLSKITSLSNDLALALASHPIRIEAPIPGKSLVGIEVPNQVRALVRLRDLIQSPNFQNSASRLTFALGKDVSGSPAYADLDRMPHLLVAGSTGTGKTVFLNTLILSLIYRNSPDILKLILIDPKRVEFPVYAGIPHLLGPAVCNNGKAVSVLNWLIEEMERRFDLFSKHKAKDISSYNELVLNGEAEHTPYIVLIVDELADLMASKGREVEAGIVRLAQMARAVGIHLVLATQRPSVEVITGLIKANVSSRVGFQVASQVDSRTVFDMSGAEKLLGRGDMLFLSAEFTKPRRIQAPLVTEKEVKKVVKFIKSKSDPAEIIGGEQLAESLKQKLEEGESGGGFDVFSRGEDPLFEKAKQVVVEASKASASLLQRRLQVGYARAARLMDMLEDRGIVGPADGAKPREVFGDVKDYQKYSEKDPVENPEESLEEFEEESEEESEEEFE